MALASGPISDASAPRPVSFVIPRNTSRYCHHPTTRHESLVGCNSPACNSHPDRHRRGFNNGMALELYATRPNESSRPLGQLSGFVRMERVRRDLFLDQTEHAKRRRSRDRLRPHVLSLHRPKSRKTVDSVRKPTFILTAMPRRISARSRRSGMA
jgi:hypothetical protein